MQSTAKATISSRRKMNKCWRSDAIQEISSPHREVGSLRYRDGWILQHFKHLVPLRMAAHKRNMLGKGWAHFHGGGVTGQSPRASGQAEEPTKGTDLADKKQRWKSVLVLESTLLLPAAKFSS